ncbi:MAG: hypothetical protein HC915_20010, partial [Anaerolineae bacterium]|nr:hypothetical protein [Anaerolineae bacterium]
AGPSFCAGLDFKSFIANASAMREGLLVRKPGTLGNLAQRVGLIWTELPMPVIAAIHGTCVGGGMQLALGADFRVAAPDARLGLLETDYGIIPDMSATITLPRLISLDVAKLLTMTARVLDGPQAHELGLVTMVADDPVNVARELARTLAGASPIGRIISVEPRPLDPTKVQTWLADAPGQGLVIIDEARDPEQVAHVRAMLPYNMVLWVTASMPMGEEGWIELSVPPLSLPESLHLLQHALEVPPRLSAEMLAPLETWPARWRGTPIAWGWPSTGCAGWGAGGRHALPAPPGRNRKRAGGTGRAHAAPAPGRARL